MSATVKVPELKSVSTESIYAWKAANVYVSQLHSRLIRFRPMVMAHPTYGIRDVAKCAFRKGHIEPPYDGCRCGFNAWHEFIVARTYLGEVLKARCRCYRGVEDRAPCYGILRVRLEGDVVEGTLDTLNLDKWGYRASRQHVTDVFFSEKCAFCGEKAEGLSLGKEVAVMPNVPDGVLFQPVQPACSKCCPALFHPNDLMANNDVGVQIGYPSNPSE